MSSEEQSPEDLQARLDRAADQLTPQELRLAAHLVEQLERWGYLSSTELAAELGVHRSTVVGVGPDKGLKG